MHNAAPTQPTTSGQTTPQRASQPTKPDSTQTVTASSFGLEASLDAFSIRSFQADLFTGTAGAEIPIVVPPGAVGVASRILLQYSSGVVDDVSIDGKHDQADWTGLGWTLDTGGFVFRDTRGTTSKNDDKFKLVFNGVTHDLIKLGTTNGYRTKDENFWLITYVSAGDYWTLKTKDGVTHRFGFNTDSKAIGLTFGPNIEVPVTFRYLIDEVSTTSGVAVRYSYFKQSASYNNKAYGPGPSTPTRSPIAITAVRFSVPLGK